MKGKLNLSQFKPTKRGAQSFIRQNLLTIATFGGVIAGVVLGVILRASKEEEWSKREAMYVSFVGKLFLSALKSIIIPLVIPSLIIAIGTLDISLSGKIGGRAIAYYMSTTLVRYYNRRYTLTYGIIGTQDMEEMIYLSLCFSVLS